MFVLYFIHKLAKTCHFIFQVNVKESLDICTGKQDKNTGEEQKNITFFPLKRHVYFLEVIFADF